MRTTLQPVSITYKNCHGDLKKSVLNWQDCLPSVDTNYQSEDESAVFFTRSVMLSLEEIPGDAVYIHPSLLYYFRIVHSKKYAILHPRDFYHWSAEDLAKTFAAILSANPQCLVLDLKDTAGGAIDQVVYLSGQLGINKPFAFFSDMINKENNLRITGMGNYSHFLEEVKNEHIWNGEVILRINPICASASDMFPRWFQLNQRGKIVGLPTTGAGGGTDSFQLTHTGTVINIPLRERILTGDHQSIEGNPILPDHYTDLPLIQILGSKIL